MPPHRRHDKTQKGDATNPADPFATRLQDDDQKLVDEFTSSGVNRTERKPFRPWWMMMWLGAAIVALGAAARLIGVIYVPY